MRATLLNRSAHYYCPLILCPRALPLPPLSATAAAAAAAPHAPRHTPTPPRPKAPSPKPQAPIGWLHFFLLFAFGGRIPPHNSGGEVRISSLSGTRHQGGLVGARSLPHQSLLPLHTQALHFSVHRSASPSSGFHSRFPNFPWLF